MNNSPSLSHKSLEGGVASPGSVVAAAGYPSTPERPIHYLRFNQCSSSLAVGFDAGYKLFSTSSALDKLESIHTAAGGSGTVGSGSGQMGAAPQAKVKIIERLFSSSLVAMVLEHEPRKLKVCPFYRFGV